MLKLSKTAIRELSKMYRAVLMGAMVTLIATGANAETINLTGITGTLNDSSTGYTITSGTATAEVDLSGYATAAQGAKADSAIQSVTTGTANGTISVDGTDVAVHGLGSAAFTDSDEYATAAQGDLANTALQKADITTGTTNGTISVKGTEIAVHGLGSAAYTESTAYDAAGSASAAEANAKTYADGLLSSGSSEAEFKTLETTGNATIGGDLIASENGFEVYTDSSDNSVNVRVGNTALTPGADRDGIMTIEGKGGFITLDGSDASISSEILVAQDTLAVTTNGLTGVFAEADGTLTAMGDATVGSISTEKTGGTYGDATLGTTTINGTLTTTGAATVGSLNAGAGTIETTGNVSAGNVSTNTLTATGAATVGSLNIGTTGKGFEASGNLNAQGITADGTITANAGLTITSGNLTLGSTSVNAIDTAGIGSSLPGDENTLATTKSVVETIKNQTQDAIYTNTVTSGSNVTETTLKGAIANLDEAIGDRTLTSANGTINSAMTTSLSAGLQAAGNVIGSLKYASTNYVRAGDDLTTAVSKLDSQLYRVEDRVDEINKEMKAGFASVAALSGLQPNARAFNDTQISVGVGNYRGQTGFALGGFHYVNDNLMMNVGAAYAGDHSATFRGGLTFGW